MLSPPVLACLAVWGCWLGRVGGPRWKTCPYRLSAQLAAALPIVAGLASGDSLIGMHGILVGAGALLGVFASGHNSRWRALGCCAVGAISGSWLGGKLG